MDEARRSPLHSADSLSVQWLSAPGEVPRPVERATQERMAQQLKDLPVPLKLHAHAHLGEDDG